MPYTFHTDPGHGWLEVPIKDCARIGLSLDNFSKHSYRDGNTLFLEEDCDMAVFIKAYECFHNSSQGPAIAWPSSDTLINIRGLDGIGEYHEQV